MLPGVLDTQLPAVVLATVQSVNGVLCVIPDVKCLDGRTYTCLKILLAVEADESKAPALLGSVILGDVDVANPPVLLKQALKILDGAPVTEAIHLEADHLGDVRRRATSSTTPTAATTIISAGHLDVKIKTLKWSELFVM